MSIEPRIRSVKQGSVEALLAPSGLVAGDMTSNGDPNAVPPIQPTYSSQSSTLPDGGFLKKNTVLRVNAATTAAITGPGLEG
jgi:hypothetical protein